jgi:hypothetical protein
MLAADGWVALTAADVWLAFDAIDEGY